MTQTAKMLVARGRIAALAEKRRDAQVRLARRGGSEDALAKLEGESASLDLAVKVIDDVLRE